MEFAVIFLLTLIVAFFILKNKKTRVKDLSVKKEEIIKEYTEQLQKIIQNNQEDKKKLLASKKEFLLKCNSELSRNIFFTTEESKKIIEKLLKL